MGFETRYIQYSIQARLYYETSLWDLKPYQGTCGAEQGAYYETSLWDLKLLFQYDLTYNVQILWDIPMGFETMMSLKTSILPKNYETSLWDLKLRFHMLLCYVLPLWDIPMGFETLFGQIFIYFYNVLWDIPMGFETISIKAFSIFIINYETSLWDLKLFF